MSAHRIVILGGGYAGIMAAQRLAHNKHVDITLINGSAMFVERIRLHERAARDTTRNQHPIADILHNRNVKVITGWVQAIDTAQHRVSYTTEMGAAQIEYDTLVYALGSTIDRDSVPGVRDFAHVLTPDGAPALHNKLAALPPGAQVLVCGGGLTGIEAVTELAEEYPHLKMTMVTRDVAGAKLSRKGRAHLSNVFDQMGIERREGQAVSRIDADAVVIGDERIPYDIVIWAGSFSVSPIAREAGFAVNGRGQIIVDTAMRSVSHPEVYAVGDAAYSADQAVPLRMACATAVPMGAHAASNILAGLEGKQAQPLPYRFFFQCISLGRNEALIQMVNADDSPREFIITGRAGALYKEMICRFAYASLKMERYLPHMYRMPDAPVAMRRQMRSDRSQAHS
jgi:NADH:ubiquinone reductase (H+-translocating)